MLFRKANLIKMSTLCSLCLVSILSQKTFATESRKSFEISSAELKVVEEVSPLHFEARDEYISYEFEKSGGEFGEAVAVIKDLVALGKEIYPLVEKGRPVVTMNNFKGISVLPRLDQTENTSYPEFYEMENWWVPGFARYNVNFKNIYGITVVDFTFSVHYQPGGSYQGAGKYLTNVAIVVDELLVRWGYDLSATVKLVGISNLGNKENRIAGATIQLEYTAKSVMNEYQNTSRFFVTGDGTLKKL